MQEIKEFEDYWKGYTLEQLYKIRDTVKSKMRRVGMSYDLGIRTAALFYKISQLENERNK